MPLENRRGDGETAALQVGGDNIGVPRLAQQPLYRYSSSR
jgi:hypothetical protein